MEFRHELKFIVTEFQLSEINNRIRGFLKKDAHQLGDYYTITSIYFDDINDSCLQENIDGCNYRSKYRIRIYDHKHDLIKLEKKEKINSMTKKTAVSLTSDECHSVIDGNYTMNQCESKNKRNILLEMKLKGMMPKSIVEYDRTVYVYPVGNVRITFDRNIRGSKNISDFWKNDKINEKPLMPKNIHVLEVKYDEFLPSFIYTLLDLDSLQWSSFSKYGASRQDD